MATETSVISFRVPPDEYDEIQAAAAAVGEAMSTYIRKAVALRRKGAFKTPVPSYANGTPRESTESGIGAVSMITTAPRPIVIDPRIDSGE